MDEPTVPSPDGNDQDPELTPQLVRPCDWCEALGEWICVHCNLALCQDCMKEHKKEHPRVDEH
ncbi:MAG TPA: B-box zinc finger protein [Thermoplasmata archaeon]|nr:B-box zinc finger protein [Thermoplasmata archaeon]